MYNYIYIYTMQYMFVFLGRDIGRWHYLSNATCLTLLV